MNTNTLYTLSLLFSLGIACVLYLKLYNRHLSMIPDHPLKAPLNFFVFVLLVAAAVVFSRAVPSFPGIMIPALALGHFAGCETWRRLVIWRREAGGLPVNTRPHCVRLLRPITTTDLTTHHFKVQIPGWQGGRLRIVQITDLHVNDSLPFDYYQNAFRIAEAAQADLALLTGDFISFDRHLTLLRRLLRPVGRIGTFASLGNHDYWAGAEGVRAAIRDAGITLLTNECLELEIDGQKLTLAGYDAPWGDSPEMPPAAPPSVPQIVMSHTPDNIEKLSQTGASLVFSGHNHAGQFRLPYWGALVVPSIYGRRFGHGHFLVGGTHLFVSSGVGSSNPAVRIYCQPDIFIVDVAGEVPEKPQAREKGVLSASHRKKLLSRRAPAPMNGALH